jgi:hypothetical protein
MFNYNHSSRGGGRRGRNGGRGGGGGGGRRGGGGGRGWSSMYGNGNTNRPHQQRGGIGRDAPDQRSWSRQRGGDGRAPDWRSWSGDYRRGVHRGDRKVQDDTNDDRPMDLRETQLEGEPRTPDPGTATSVGQDTDMEVEPHSLEPETNDGRAYKGEMKVDDSWLSKPFEKMEWSEKIFSQVSVLLCAL